MKSEILDIDINPARQSTISKHYHEKEVARLLIAPDSSALLLLQRISMEPRYKERFDYNLLDSL
jgi:hypothetical protein